MKVLVTGARGQLGQALQNNPTSIQCLPFDHASLDITDEKRVIDVVQKEQPDAIINAAAYNDVDKAESEADKAFAVNAEGPKNLAEAAKKRGIPFVHVSTDYVFDGQKTSPYHELDQVNPLSTYAKSKWQGEVKVRETYEFHYIVRTAWVFHQRGENFFTKLIRLSEKGPLSIVNDQFSSPTYAPHLARGIFDLLESQCFGTYHMAGQGVTSRFKEFEYFLEQSHLPIKIRPVSSEHFPQKATRPRYTALTTIQVPRIILPPWEQGIQEFVKGA